MPDMNTGTFDPDKIAELLNKAADEYKSSKLTLKDKIGEPKVFDAIKNLKRKGASDREVCAILDGIGIKTTPQSLSATLRRINRETKGEADEKPRRERKASTAANASEATKQASGGTAKPTEEKPADKQGDKPAKSEGRKLNQSPSMGGAFNQNEL